MNRVFIIHIVYDEHFARKSYQSKISFYENHINLKSKNDFYFQMFYFPGIHPTTISDSFQKAAGKAVDILTKMAIPLDLNDRESLLKSANTSLNSKVG